MSKVIIELTKMELGPSTAFGSLRGVADRCIAFIIHRYLKFDLKNLELTNRWYEKVKEIWARHGCYPHPEFNHDFYGLNQDGTLSKPSPEIMEEARKEIILAAHEMFDIV